MALTFVSGSTNSSTSETDLFTTVTSDNYHSCLVFLQNLAAGDIMVFRCYVRDDNAAANRVWLTETRSGAQTDLALYFAPIATRTYRITVQRITGADRAITWTRAVS